MRLKPYITITREMPRNQLKPVQATDPETPKGHAAIVFDATGVSLCSFCLNEKSTCAMNSKPNDQTMNYKF